jgi:DNA polymerase III subunit gamma/tau
MPYEPIHHKYRPQTFKDLVGQETIALTLSNALKQEKIATAYLFTGPRGTGKTSSARILAKSLNCLASDRPTVEPCGKCEVCLAIAKGSALDVMEIDAASNTGVDNIREIIERSRFAPVQCRYKVYVIDECLKGNSLIQTDNGLMRIDDPHLEGKKVLSYNEGKKVWEYKRVLRWLERGTKKTLTIKTNNHQICCTSNHLIRTEAGWIEAKNVKEGMKILSPVSADAGRVSTNTVRMDEYADLYQDISLKKTNSAANLTTLAEFLYKQNTYNLPFFQWTTNLETVESVSHAGHEQVYDLEVEGNHNFIANGLLVHNCHMLSTAAFNALLKTLEEPPPQVVFILATTDPQRVLSTIISRCQRFDYRRISLLEMVKHLKYIAEAEKIAIADDALTLIAQIANGGLRDAESLLDQLSLLPDTILVEKVWDLVGAVPEQDLLKLLQAIAQDNSLAVLQQCRSLLDRGREPIVVLQNLASFYLNLLIAKTAPQRSDLVAVTETCWQQLCNQANSWDTGLILRGQQHLKEAETQLKRTTQPRLWLEVTLLGLLPQAHQISIIPPNPVINISSSDNLPKISAPPPQNNIPPNHNQQAANAKVNQVNQLNQSPPAVKKPQEVAETAKSQLSVQETVTPTPEPVNQPTSQPTNSNINLEDTWQRVISCLQPPTTQALLKQQCHLISFDGASAIVGISSATLQKLNQGKIPNIEKAFVQVVQHQVKVQLEVASTKDNSAKKNSVIANSLVNSVSDTPKSTVIAAHEPNLIEPKSLVEPKSPNFNSAATTPLPISNLSDVQPASQSVAIQSEVTAFPPQTSIRQDSNPVDETDDLQKAIANLTLSFEGELVQMGNNLNQSLELLAEEVQPEKSESVKINDPGRPNVEDYNDDW